MKPRYCYWSVVNGEYALMAQAVVDSARRVGVFKDFHIWTDKPIEGAICHEAGDFERWGCLFKLLYLRDAVRKLDYDYFIWMDMDSYFVRQPGDVLRVLRGSPLHIALECDVCRPENKRTDWWSCPNARFAELMRARGVRGRSIFNVNGGLFIVHREAIQTVFELAYDFYTFCRERGFTFNDEPLLAYAMQMLCGDPKLHTLEATTDLWCSDWKGEFKDRLPDGQPWHHEDYFTGAIRLVNPAIVHVMRGKDALVQAGANRRTEAEAVTVRSCEPRVS